MIADIFEQRPGVWFNTSSIEQRMDLIVTMFKISTCVTHILSDQDHNDITNVWYNAVNSFTQLDSTSGVQKQYIQPISEMFVQYVRNRLSYLSAINDTNPDKLPLQPSIDILARQTWKFLCVLKVSIYNNESPQILVLSKMFLQLYTPPLAEILCVINPRAIVVCGFLMKSL